MKIVINIEKRYAFMIFGAILFLAVVIGVYAAVTPFANTETKVGHSASEVGPGTITGPINITGSIEATGNLNLTGNLSVGEKFTEAGKTLCKTDGTGCQVTVDTPVNGSIMGMAAVYGEGSCSRWGVGFCSGSYPSTRAGCRGYTQYILQTGFGGKIAVCVKQ